jgi:hypothetical protein
MPKPVKDLIRHQNMEMTPAAHADRFLRSKDPGGDGAAGSQPAAEARAVALIISP